MLHNALKPLSSLDLMDKLGAKLVQLDALLARTYGEEGDTLRGCSGDIQDNYHWACSSMASECNALHTQLCTSLSGKLD